MRWTCVSLRPITDAIRLLSRSMEEESLPLERAVAAAVDTAASHLTSSASLTVRVLLVPWRRCPAVPMVRLHHTARPAGNPWVLNHRCAPAYVPGERDRSSRRWWGGDLATTDSDIRVRDIWPSDKGVCLPMYERFLRNHACNNCREVKIDKYILNLTSSLVWSIMTSLVSWSGLNVTKEKM